MGKVGDFFDKLFAPSEDNCSDWAFTRRMKRWQNEYGQDNIEKLLPLAYRDRSVKSAFWWYEHLTEKPDVTDYKWAARINVKYMISFGQYVKKGFSSEEYDEMKTSFIELFLPDIDYRNIVNMHLNGHAYTLVNKTQAAKTLSMRLGKNKYPFADPVFWFLTHSESIKDNNVDVNTMNWADTVEARKWHDLIAEIYEKVYSNAERLVWGYRDITWDMVEQQIASYDLI